MKTTLIMIALLAMFAAGCQTTGGGTSVEQPPENGQNTTDDGQDAKEVVFVLGVNGMD